MSRNESLVDTTKSYAFSFQLEHYGSLLHVLNQSSYKTILMKMRSL